jgi:hypothetical protein
MKKIIIIAGTLCVTVTASAQGTYDPFHDRIWIDNFSRSSAIILVLTLIAAFIIKVIKLILDYRLKNKMIDKGVSETLAGRMLQSNNKNNKHIALKWFSILAGIGVGLTLISLFPPFGIHSLIIMAFSVAAGFLGYYYFTSRAEKQETPNP